MFYCDTCARKNRWPMTLIASFGNCEACGVRTHCNSCPSSQLPEPQRNIGEEWAELHDHKD